MGRSPLRIAGAAAIAALAVVAAGCGGSSSPSASSGTTTTTTTGSGASTADRTAFNTCLAQHGVKLPNRPAGGGNGQPPAGGPGGGGGGGLANLTAAQRQAFTACRSKLPGGGFPGRGAGGGGGANASNPAFAKYTACLKQHGVTLGGTNNQTTFAKASAACAKYRPTPGATTTTP
ncbi:MAG: hypothetical protein ACJ757_18545 [Gaiellaceae bacterium]